MGNIDDSGYTFKKIYGYSGRTTDHHVYAVYPDDTEWGSHQNGSYPYTQVAQWNLDDDRDSCGPKSVTFTSKFNDKRYKVTASRCTRSMVWSWSLLPEGAIDKVECPSTVDPNEWAHIYAYIKNTGGKGEFKVLLMEGDVRIASESKIIPENETGRLTLIARMPAKDWHLRIDLEESGVVRDSEEFTISKKVCTEGERRYATECWDGSVIHTEVCHNNAWTPTGETCPTKPECKEGDKKAGYICEGGKWVAYTPPVVPPVVPPVEPPVTPPVTPPAPPPAAPPKYLTPAQANERILAGLPCYIKCTLPILNMLPAISYTQGAWVLPFFTITSEP